MTAVHPPPLVPSNVDLQDFRFMPLDIPRLFGSEFHATSDDSTWRAGLTLWLKSYHQLPAASLPNDDVALARLAELGRDQRTWKRIRAGALRGWTLCSDGRLYHKVVAEKALEAWIEKVAQRKASGAGNAKRYNYPFDHATFDRDIEIAQEHLRIVNPQSRMLSRKGGKYAPGNPNDKPPRGESRPSTPPAGTPYGSADAIKTAPGGSESTSDEAPRDRVEGVPREDKGREEKGTKTIIEKYLSPSGRATDDALALFFEAFAGKPREQDGVRRELGRRLLQGVVLADILAGARDYAERCRDRGPDHIASPVRWLVDGRWKDGLQKRSGAVRPPGQTYVERTDDRWPALERRYRSENANCTRAGPWNSSKGWYFPDAWIENLTEDVSA